MSLAHDPWRLGADLLAPTRPTLVLRDKQRWPAGDWRTWLLLAGRRFGKTLTAAYHLAERGAAQADLRIAIVAPTIAAGRDICVEGDTGLLHFLPTEVVRTWNRSLGELRLTNGTLYRVMSADEPDRIRGWGFHLAWFDELASVRGRDAWDQLQMALSSGSEPRTIVTTTPRPTPLVRELVARTDGSVFLTRGSTSENAANLAPSVLTELHDRYAGTRLGRQELEAEILDDVEGALWSPELIRHIPYELLPTMRRKVVFLDPSTGSGSSGSDEAGIIVAGLGLDQRGYVLADLSLRCEPSEWARVFAQAYDDHGCDMALCEDAFGQLTLVRLSLKSIGRTDLANSVRGIKIRAGKRLRAEPVLSLYEQEKIVHVESRTPGLEDQMLTWVPDESDFSPDRVDALVGALTDLMLTGRSGVVQIADVAGATWRR